MNLEKISKLILAPHVSEKATASAGKNRQYIFKVMKCATKQLVKQAIELLFKTKVKNVRIVNVKTKPKRFGSIMGSSKAWKKAYVTLQDGQEIEFAGVKQ